MITVNNNTLAHGAFVKLARYTIIFSLLLFSNILKAQGFTISVAATPETCSGNGALTFTPQNAAPSPAITYQVYLMPNGTTDLASNTTATSLPGLAAGTYQVIATQGTATYTTTATIENQLSPMVFGTFTEVPAYCGPDGSITVIVTSGNPVSYQLIAGPNTTGVQTSNTFNNISAGNYTIKITDSCGDSNNIFYTLSSSAPVLSVSAGSFPDVQLPDCNHITAVNTVVPNNGMYITYPLTATFTVYPPGGGAPIVFTQTVENGLPDEAVITQVIPLYYLQNYHYDVTVTDPCGTPYYSTNNDVVAMFQAGGIFNDLGCGNKILKIVPLQFVAPYTITFTNNVPEDFDPEEFSDIYPNPFYGETADFGDMDNPVPYGSYEFTVTDACGRTYTTQGENEPPPPADASVATSNIDCVGNKGKVIIEIPGFIIATGSIESGPADYEFPPNEAPRDMPVDVTSFLNTEQKLEVPGLPPGNYVFIVTDTCGNTYTVPVTIPEYSAGTLSSANRPGCQPGFGSVFLGTNSPALEVLMTNWPSAYTVPTSNPYDVSSNIYTNGYFYMDNLPPGQYTFKLSTSCQNFPPQTINVVGYNITQNNITHTPLCGSFNLELHHTANAISGVGFWLQKEIDPVAGTWGHPNGSGVPYVEGEQPGAANSLSVQNNFINNNLIYPTGHYRVLKSFKSYGSGSTVNEKICTENIYDFEYYNTLTVLSIQNISCSGTIADVQINAVGVDPITYTITHANGIPLTTPIVNGSNNVFANLPSASYIVSVTDLCNTKTFNFNIADLPPLVTASTAPDLFACDDDGNGTETFDLSLQTPIVLGLVNTADVTLSYYASQSDADAAINPLPLTFTTGSTTVYAKVQHNTNATCSAMSTFNITVRPKPVIVIDDLWRGCENEPITITANPGFVQYDWDNGATGQIIDAFQQGPLTLTVTDVYGCQASKTIQVVTSAEPVISEIVISDWTDHDNSITVYTEQDGTASVQNFEYSLDGLNFQTSNIFNGLDPGKYAVFVRDKYGCGMAPASTYLLTYPRYFTPNGDGQNEKWRIKFSTQAEPDLMVYIYDRYGKLITGFGANSEGWDGTYNGYLLPSTDYWFVVRRQNGKEFKGHFAMIR